MADITSSPTVDQFFLRESSIVSIWTRYLCCVKLKNNPLDFRISNIPCQPLRCFICQLSLNHKLWKYAPLISAIEEIFYRSQVSCHLPDLCIIFVLNTSVRYKMMYLIPCFLNFGHGMENLCFYHPVAANFQTFFFAPLLFFKAPPVLKLLNKLNFSSNNVLI